jgi:hypothetical protein
MHQDARGYDLGGYGLRLRPFDMQKLGLLYMDGGQWQGRQLLPADWVEKAWHPYMKSDVSLAAPDYGWFWWSYDFDGGYHFLVANGWKGQRIAIDREHGLVFTMTAAIEADDEAVFRTVMREFIVPAMAGGAGEDADAALIAASAALNAAPSRVGAATEARMVPAVAPKETHRAFKP